MFVVLLTFGTAKQSSELVDFLLRGRTTAFVGTESAVSHMTVEWSTLEYLSHGASSLLEGSCGSGASSKSRSHISIMDNEFHSEKYGLRSVLLPSEYMPSVLISDLLASSSIAWPTKGETAFPI